MLRMSDDGDVSDAVVEELALSAMDERFTCDGDEVLGDA
jgi:hypothetical protein